MTSGKSVTVAQPIEIDPNFFLPPNVVDMRYVNQEDANLDSATTRDSDTGEVVNYDYDDLSYSEDAGDGTDPVGSAPIVVAPPDAVTVVSQQVRQTADGKFVVDVILEVDDVPGAVNYDVRLTKPS